MILYSFTWTGAEAIRCDFLDGNCLRTFYIIGTGFATGPIHSEKAGNLLEYTVKPHVPDKIGRLDCSGLLIPVWSIVVIIVGGLLLLGVLLLIIIKCVLVGLVCLKFGISQFLEKQCHVPFLLLFSPSQSCRWMSEMMSFDCMRKKNDYCIEQHKSHYIRQPKGCQSRSPVQSSEC